MPKTQVGSVLFETIVDGAISIDTNGNIMQFNPACEAIFGYTPDEVMGRNVRMLMPPPYRDQHDEYISNYLTTGNAKIIGIGREVQGLRKDGSVFPMELSVGMSKHSDPPFFVGIVRDVSARVEAEQRVRDSEERLRSVFETAVDGIIIIDDTGRVELFNPACEKLFGYVPQEVIGQNVRMLMPEPFRGEHDGYIENYLTTGDAKIIGSGREVRGQRKNASTFPMELSVGHCEIGERPHFVGVIRDVTDRKALETALTDQADQLKDALERERAVNEMQREFMSMATHEFRTPLAVIDATAQRLSSTLGRATKDDELSRRLESIRNNVRRITQLIDSTLELAKADANEIDMECRDVDIAQLCRDVAGRLNEVEGIDRVKVQVGTGKLVSFADPHLIERTVENVVTNGLKYSQQPNPVDVTVKDDDDEIVIDIADQGPGIPTTELTKIFDRYYRVRTTSSLPGAGLGLHMCRKFLSMHGGTIGVTSEVGTGTTFTIRLPK